MGVLETYGVVIHSHDTSGGSRISRRGGVDLVGGASTPEAVSYVSKILYVETKESEPLLGGGRGRHQAHPLDPPMDTTSDVNL